MFQLKKNKIKAIPLKVSAPFHCALMEPAAEKMKKKIDKTVFSKPDYKIISNVNKNWIPKNELSKVLLLIIKVNPINKFKLAFIRSFGLPSSK